ncbi:membrane dipeptidase [Streptomyces sp. NBC_00233]|uniref:membrane dipeptidase n=1 Tax=Streptomyces sp. NBC_00233 TaxID=2975686 RepID=UPI002258F62A|nr:membrane dipeptidase [Streptomyces sp. NBC_00233]MCX5226592.1 dipeptidase [Streptomyces sp. NBC_00233]
MAELLDDHPTLSTVPAAAGEPAPPEPPPPLDETSRARAVLAAQPVVEGHTELPLSLDPEDLPPVRAAEAGAQFWSLHVDADEGVIGTLRRIDAVRALVAACPEDLRLAHTTSEMADARNCGRVAALLGPVSWTALGASAATLRAYHALGVRAVGLTRFDRFARDAVREMNRLGLAVDLSGADQDTVRRALAVTRAPALLTRAAPEGLPDDVLGLLGENGAVCMVTVTDDPAAVADVLDRVRTEAGAHCVGVSHTTAPAVGYVPLFAELLRRGWTAQELVGLAHGNVTRALRETEFLSRTNRIRPAAA